MLLFSTGFDLSLFTTKLLELSMEWLIHVYVVMQVLILLKVHSMHNFRFVQILITQFKTQYTKQGSHSSWKIWKNYNSFASPGKVLEFYNFIKNPGKMNCLGKK